MSSSFQFAFNSLVLYLPRFFSLFLYFLLSLLLYFLLGDGRLRQQKNFCHNSIFDLFCQHPFGYILEVVNLFHQ